MTTNFLIGVRGLAARFALQIMLGAAFGAGQMAVQPIAAAHAPVSGQVLQPQAASAPMADIQPAAPAPATPAADAGDAAPGFVGLGWG